MISPALQEIFERVRDGADFMPSWQLEVNKVIKFKQMILKIGTPLYVLLCILSHVLREKQRYLLFIPQ